MAEYSGFFNAELVNGEYDRTYLAETFAKYFSLFVANGVFPNPSDGIQVFENTTPDMNVLVHPGYGWINGYWYQLDNNHTLAIDPADGVLNRIDRIVVRWDLEEREVYLTVLKGTPASDPSAPEIVRSADYYDLCVAEITVDAGITQIRQSMITDTRSNSDLCGIVTGVVQSIDTTTLFNQYQAALSEFEETKLEEFDEWSTDQQQAFNDWFANIQGILDGDTAGNLLNLINQETANRQTADTALETKITNNTGINATATHEGTTVSITAPTDVSIITFLAPSDWAEGETYTVNSETVELVDLNGGVVEDAWVQGSPVSLTITGGKAFFKNGGGRYKPTDLPPLNPNFTMEISEGDSEDTVTVTADKLTISPTTDMLAGGQWEYGTEMSPAPGKGQNIKYWTREQLVTSGKPFDGLLLGDVTASDAANETILWLPENQSGEIVLVPFIVLSTDYLGGVYVTRLYTESKWLGAFGSNSTYAGSTADNWFEKTYLGSILHESVSSQLLTCDVPVMDQGTVSRRCWPLSSRELDSLSSEVGGEFMPYFSTPQRRISYLDGGTTGGVYWMRTKSDASEVFTVTALGGFGTQPSTYEPVAYRPAFVLPKDFLIQQRPDGSYTVYNDYGLITLGDIQASTSSDKIVINLLENSGNASYLYLSKNYNDSDRGLIQRENIPFEQKLSNPDYTSGSGFSNVIVQWCQNNIDVSVQSLVEDVSFKYMKSTHVSGREYSFSPADYTAKYFALSASEMGGSDIGTGTVIPYFEDIPINRVKTYNGTAKTYFTRDIASQTASNTARFYTVSASGSISIYSYDSVYGNVPAFTLPLTAPIRLLADGTYDLVPEDPSLSAQTVSTLAEEQSGTTVQLNQIPAGSVLKIKENGQDVDFYVAKHDYESELNGAGRTLLVRKDCYDNWVWDSGNVNAYAESDIDSWFNNTYKSLLDERIQEAIGTTKIRYTPGYNNTVGTLERAIFALSLTELGQSHSYANTEGSALPIASTLRIAYRNGSPTTQWTRSPNTGNAYSAWLLDTAGHGNYRSCDSSYGSRPVFTLPGDSYATANDDGTYTFTGEDTSSPVVSFSFTVPHGTQPVVRQYTYNYEEHYQTMLEGGVLPALGGDTGPTYSEVLAENTWAQIAQAVADKDPILDVWQVGDTKDEVIAGETLTFAIMGKNMDDLADGSGKAGLTFGMTQLMASTRQMNSSNTNSGSFAGSAMYSWLSGTIYPNLPAELKDAIKTVNKKTSSGDGSSAIRTDSMYLWLFSEIEVFGTTTYSYAGEGTQYPYFATAAERIKRLSNGAGAASYWWERSPDRNNSNHFCIVSTSGSADYGDAIGSHAVCFGFCI